MSIRLTLGIALTLLAGAVHAQSLPSPSFAVPTAPAQAAVKSYVDSTVASLASSLALVATAGSYASLTGRPALAPVATSGAYADLTGAPAAYALPTASPSVLGGVKIDGTTITISGGTLSVPTDASRYAASNPAGYITAAGAPVQSVAGLAGAPTAAQLSGALAGTAAGTLAAGNDSRILAAQTAAQVSSAIAAGTAANVSGTVALANGGTGATAAPAARTALGLGTAAVLDAGTTSGTLADGGLVATHTTQIAARLVAASNLSDLAAPATARSNLGLGGAAVLNVGSAAGTVAAGNDSRINGALPAATAAATYAALSGVAFTGPVTLGGGGTNPISLGSTGQYFGWNVAYSASAFRYVANDYASWWRQDGAAGVSFHSAVSGTAGAAITDTVALNISPAGVVTLPINPLGLGSGGTGGSTAAAARTNLGLGGAAQLNVGTAASTVAAGDDARITGALAVTTAAATYAPLAAPQLTGIVKVGAAGTTFINDTSLPLQLNSTAAAPAFFAVNKNGAYGALYGYDPSLPAMVVRNVTTDPLSLIVNNTTQALVITSDGSARFPFTATAATVRVGSTSGPTWTTGTGAPTSTQPIGSIYSRTDGAVGTSFYVSHGGGSWTAAMML